MDLGDAAGYRFWPEPGVGTGDQRCGGGKSGYNFSHEFGGNRDYFTHGCRKLNGNADLSMDKALHGLTSCKDWSASSEGVVAL
jgi:hypothetical protein